VIPAAAAILAASASGSPPSVTQMTRRLKRPDVANEFEAQGPDASNGGLCHSSYGIDAMRQFIIIQTSP
jgi:hypothetical protein